MKKPKGNQTTPVSIKEQLDQAEEYFNQHPEIAFAISFKSKTVSSNWTGVQANLSKTLRSIMANTDQGFRIVIAGHEKPDIEELRHDRVKWLPVDFPPPVDSGRFSSDKMHKRRTIGAYLGKKGFSGYLMPLDADDWIHYRFVEFIRSCPVSDAFIINKGLMANVALNEVWLRNRFYRGCGSSAVFYFSNKDLPISAKREDVDKTPFAIVTKDHKQVAQHLEKIHRGYSMVDFPFVTWVLGHGDNNSVLKGHKDNDISAKNYNAIGEKLEEWFYDYFKIRDI